MRTYAVTHPPNLNIRQRTVSGWDQLAHASLGVMSIRTDEGTWVVPPHRGIWIPAGTRHDIEMSSRVSVRTLFLRCRLARGRLPRRPLAVNVTPLLRELILHACRIGVLRSNVAAHGRLAGVIVDQLETLPTNPLRLPLPRDPRAQHVANRILNDPDAQGSIETAVRGSGASRRTLERLFLAETRLTLGRWRQRARLIHALRSLAHGASVTEVALDVGYSTPSAFVHAFKSELGSTPGRYFEDLAPAETDR